MLWENLRVTLQVSVIGTNYLGATHAAGMAEFGHHVIGVDIDVDRVKTLNAGQSHIFEVGLEPLLEMHTASGRLRFTTDYTEIADWADVHFLALGTPSAAGGAADLVPVARCGGHAGTAADQAHAGGRQVHRAGRHGNGAGGTAAQLGAGRRRRRGRLESGVPARGVRRGGHATARPAGLRNALSDTRWTCWRRSMRSRSATVSP